MSMYKTLTVSINQPFPASEKRGASMAVDSSVPACNPCMTIYGQSGELVRISFVDGSVTLSPDCNVDAAAMAFWDAVRRNYSHGVEYLPYGDVEHAPDTMLQDGGA